MEEYIINNCIKFWKEITMNYKEGDITKFNTIIHIVDNMPMDCYVKSYMYILKIENENTNLKQALNEIKEIVKGYMPTNQSVCKAMDEIEKIIDKVGGNND